MSPPCGKLFVPKASIQGRPRPLYSSKFSWPQIIKQRLKNVGRFVWEPPWRLVAGLDRKCCSFWLGFPDLVSRIYILQCISKGILDLDGSAEPSSDRVLYTPNQSQYTKYHPHINSHSMLPVLFEGCFFHITNVKDQRQRCLSKGKRRVSVVTIMLKMKYQGPWVIWLMNGNYWCLWYIDGVLLNDWSV